MGDNSPSQQDKSKTIFCWTSDQKYKIVLVGDSGVGKTSVFWQYIEEYFPEDVEELKVTMVDFKIKNMVIDNELVKLYIWDTAGQERYRAMISNYFKGTHGIILIFDQTNAASFESLSASWLSLCRLKSPDAILSLVGNKSELAARATPLESINKFANENGMKYFEVSAFNGTGVNEIFDHLAHAIKNKFFKKPPNLKINDEEQPESINNDTEDSYQQSPKKKSEQSPPTIPTSTSNPKATKQNSRKEPLISKSNTKAQTSQKSNCSC